MVGGEIVADDDAFERGTQYGVQHVGGAGRVDMENREIAAAENPGPVALAALPAAGLVNVENGFVPEAFQRILVGRFQRVRHPAEGLGDVNTKTS